MSKNATKQQQFELPRTKEMFHASYYSFNIWQCKCIILKFSFQQFRKDSFIWLSLGFDTFSSDARNSQKVYGTKSLQINVTCLSNDNLEDTSLNAVYGSEDIPEVEVGDENPFGVESEVIVNYGSCHSPKTMACMYCGFDDGMVGVDEDSWNMWQTIEVIDLIY